ncbi:MAG: hypothetical protein JRE10_14575 [Deltaproteobacteria bacterium]|nr:hypothetical protein [Deltaproteobacteria bacterium]
MPQIDLYKIFSEFDSGQIASIIYGNQLIEDNFPIDDPYTGAWGISTKTISIPACYRNTAFVNQEEETSTTDLPENQDPITQTTLLKREEDQVQELIFRIKRSKSICYREGLANRLLSLFNDAKEEDPDCLGIAAKSLRNFNNFLHLNTNLKCPTISLTPDYNIYASWKGEQGRVFSLHFLPNEDVRFVIFKPNDRHPERKIRVSGIATTDVLMETVMSYRIEEWISE